MKVVIAEEISPGAEALLSGNRVVKAPYSSKQFSENLKDADALIVRTYTRVDENLLQGASKLRYVVRCGVGVENIDMDACESRNVKVINAPGSNADSVAEHTVLMILASMRNLTNSHNHVVGGGWDRHTFVGNELKGKTVGLLGFGAIGRGVAKRLHGFDVNILAYDVVMDGNKAQELGVKPVELDELLKESHIISVHVPLLDSTRHMVDEGFINRMRTGSVIINTSRGAIVDEAALISGLRSGKLSFAGLDVFENEPLVDSELLRMDNVILTPHIAGVTHESFDRMCSEPVMRMLGDANES
jgi:D-3-phosphoglycerate dehydrogenase